MHSDRVYHVAGAGRWFPSDPAVLRHEVERYMHCVLPSGISLPLLGGIAPHAGFGYSGAVAGHTYAALRASAASCGAPDVCVVLGFSHRPAVPGFALLDVDMIHTPLGCVSVDRDAVQHFAQSVRGARLDNDTHMGEHAAENQLPFLQCALPDVPVCVGLLCGHDETLISDVVQALLLLDQKRSLVCIASTDLLHDPSYETVCKTDLQTIKRMEKLDLEGLNKAWSCTHQVCCGIGPVSVLLGFVRACGTGEGKVLFYQNSGDVDPSGRGQWVVGYGAIVYSRDNAIGDI